MKNPHYLSRIHRFGLIKHGLETAPREEIGMYYPIGITAKQKVVRRFKTAEDKLKLNVCYILHLIERENRAGFKEVSLSEKFCQCLR